MKVVIDGRASSVELADPDDLKGLSVVVRDASPEQAAVLLRDLGTLEDLHAWLNIAALRALGPRAGSSSWDERFTAAMSYAQEKNWTDPTGTFVRAHVEPPTGEG